MARSSDSIFPLSIIRDKTFQAREIRRVLGLSAIYLVLTTVMVGVFYHYMINSLVDGIAPLLFVSEDMQMANDAVPTLSAVLGKWMIAMLAINAAVTICLGVYITRNLGRPLLAIKRTLREIGGGNLNARLRATDSSEFGEISSELIAAMRTVREKIAAAKQEIDQADNKLNNIESKDGGTTDVDDAVRNCKVALDYFQVDRADDQNQKAA